MTHTPSHATRGILLMVAAMAVFAERPDVWVILGSGLIVMSGIAAMRFGRGPAQDT